MTKPAQLNREIDEVLQARQRRAAKTATAQPRSNVPGQAEYERRESAEARRRLDEIEKAPLADRKEAAADFLTAMRDPELVAERLGWLLNGSYGYGAMIMSKRIVANTRLNRNAALTHMVGAFEWQCPVAMAIGAWKKLSGPEQAKLDRAVAKVIASYSE